MSDFVESNRFIIDDLKVDYRPEVSKVRFDVKVPSATSIKLDFDKVYDKYEVIVAKSELNFSNIDNSQIVLQKEVDDLIHKVEEKDSKFNREDILKVYPGYWGEKQLLEIKTILKKKLGAKNDK